MLLCMISYSVMSGVLHVKYCNHLLAVDMAGVACRGVCMRVVGKISKDIGMGVCLLTIKPPLGTW